jgi:ATP-dependent phosphoenolpyruvate carboxykinase
MSKQKTALDELMDFIEEGNFEFISDIFDKAKELKDTEQKQIIEAFKYGAYVENVKERLDYDPEDFDFNNADEYFDFTFNIKL